MTLDLSGPIAKLDRAELHLDALTNEVRQEIELNGQRMETRYNPIDESLSSIFKEGQPVPRSKWGLILGDAVHNLRSALDHLVAVMVADTGNKVHRTHQFPIFDQPSDWQSKVVKPPKNRRGFLDFIGAAHVAVIEEVQPYQPATGLKTLATVRDFSNTDKHTLIHVVRRRLTARPIVTAFHNIPATITEVTYSDPGSALEDGAEVARVRASLDLPVSPLTGAVGFPPGTEMNMRVDLSATVVFGPPGQEDARIEDFQRCLADCRALLARF
jgi:hypothetical protein